VAAAGCAGGGAMTRELVCDIEQFLFREARLLDEGRFREWLDLLHEDIRYWMPSMGRRYRTSSKAMTLLNADLCMESEFSGESELAILDETKESLERRVARLESGMAWAEDPPSHTCHIVSNVAVIEGDPDTQLRVHSNFVLYRTRGESEQDFYVGRRQDVLRRVSGDWRIVYRKILLPQHVLAAKNASNFF
jgi:3-phenylpropionate/cinnamic acid dioxygenase small subunit